MNRTILITGVFATLLFACNKEAAPPAHTTSEVLAPTVTSSTEATEAPVAVGKAAPEFALKDLDGQTVRLSSFKGKVVVLEWFNPGCPFVERAHTKGSLKGAAARYAKEGVVWLAINSGAPGKQGHGIDVNRAAAKKFGLEHPILLDESGEIGRKFGATNTPHLIVIDEKGTIAYRGAVDNSPDGEGESPVGGKLVSYVDEAIVAVRKGIAPATPETKAYGCGVKYAR